MSALVVAFLLGLVGRELVGPRKRKDHEPRMLSAPCPRLDDTPMLNLADPVEACVHCGVTFEMCRRQHRPTGNCCCYWRPVPMPMPGPPMPRSG